MRLGIKDKKVIRAFTEKRELEGQKLWTDGKTLGGHWIGGRELATWVGGKIHFPSPGGIIAQSIQRAVRREAVPVDLEDYKPRRSRDASKSKRNVRWLEDRQDRSSDAYWRLAYKARRLAEQGRYDEARKLAERAKRVRSTGDRYARAKVKIGVYNAPGKSGWSDRDPRKSERRYHVVVINERTGKKVRMTATPVTHRQGVTLLSKLTDYPSRRKQLEEVRRG